MKSSSDPQFRPDLYLVARIISTLYQEGSKQKTELSIETGFAYDRLVNYLSWMTEKNLINEEDSTIILTPKGYSTYDKLVDWIMEYVGKLEFHRETQGKRP